MHPDHPPLRLLCACLSIGLAAAAPDAGAAGFGPTGVDRQSWDASVRVQDDFFRHANGGWLKATPIPPDRSRVGAFEKLNDDTT
ncbi:MAG TPA: M13 family peptidase, partial [Methylibium sp.]|nr:M13 family peptidase [Methylibium sp.]